MRPKSETKVRVPVHITGHRRKRLTLIPRNPGQVYAGVAHPYLDDSGKTLTVTYTNHPNTIEAIKISFGPALRSNTGLDPHVASGSTLQGYLVFGCIVGVALYVTKRRCSRRT